MEDHTAAAAAAPANPPPPPQRRPRVREVSSRFMTPVATSSSSFSPLAQHHQRSSSVQKQRRHLEFDNKDSSLDGSTSNTSSSSGASAAAAAPTPHRRHPPQSHRTVSSRVFKDLANGERHDPAARSHRPDTPALTAPPTSIRRMAAHQRSSGNNNATSTAAAKLLQSSTGMSSSVNFSSNSSESCTGDNNRSSHGSRSSSSSRSVPDLRSSMPEPATVSSRLLTERSLNTLDNASVCSDSASTATTTTAPSKVSAYSSPCSRSLDLQRSSSENSSFFHSIRGSEKSSRQQFNHHSFKMGGGLPLPPVPHAKLPTDAAAVSRKGRRASNQQEDIHNLRMIHNRYLQWRYANAKSEAATQAQSREAEMMVYSLGFRISEMYESVMRKRIELARLQRLATLSTVLETQMPLLDEWTSMDAEYNESLSDTTQALLNTSIQLPIGGNVKADAREITEALTSSVKLMESIASQIDRYMPNAEETEKLVSELARVSGGETSRVQECGDLLSKMHKSQIEECSVRGQIIQFNHRPVSNQILTA
ncbi:Protein ENDOSPERM DEFECTIVE 1 [Linum grandiflorum]